MQPLQNNDLLSDDPHVFIRFYKDNWKLLYQSAYRILKDKQACEDIVQDVFINIWKKRHTLQIRTSLTAYLASSVRYEVYRKIREEKKFEPIAEGMADIYFEFSVGESMEYKDTVSQISTLVQKLPEKCREVYILSRNEQLSHKEISDRLSISPKTVRNHLTNALKQLRLGGTEFFILFSVLLSAKNYF